MAIKPVVSILVPAFNSESFISQTIASALAQTWPRTEIIIVDDGSTDGTLSVARQFASKHVLVVTQPNRGASAARNEALSLSQGDFIQWLDADDLLSPDKITRQMDALRDSSDHRLLLSSAWAHFLYRIRRARFVVSPLWTDLTPLEWLLRKMEHNAHMQPATWLVSREVTQAAGIWDTRLTLDDDGEYFCRVIAASSGIRFVPEARTYYRMTGPSSLSYVGACDKKIESQFLSCKLHVDYVLRLEDSERSRAACLKYLQKYVPLFHGLRPDLVSQLEHIALELGGQLAPPRLNWKYAWIHQLFGWDAARRSERYCHDLKWILASYRDKTLFDLEEERKSVSLTCGAPAARSRNT